MVCGLPSGSDYPSAARDRLLPGASRPPTLFPLLPSLFRAVSHTVGCLGSLSGLTRPFSYPFPLAWASPNGGYCTLYFSPNGGSPLLQCIVILQPYRDWGDALAGIAISPWLKAGDLPSQGRASSLCQANKCTVQKYSKKGKAGGR